MGDGPFIEYDEDGGSPTLVLRQLVGRIEAIPEHHSVVKGAKVRYRFVLEERVDEGGALVLWDGKPSDGPTPAQQQFDETGRTEHPIPWEILQELGPDPTVKDLAPMLAWMAIYDKKAAAPAYEIVARSGAEVEITWRYPGQHLVLVQIAYFSDDRGKSGHELAKTQILFTQRVSDVETIQRRRMEVSRGKPPPHPITELEALERYLETVKAVEASYGVPKAKEAEYRRELAKKEKYLDRMQDMFQYYRTNTILLPLRASYVSKNTSEQTELRVCLHERWNLDSRESRFEVTLIDWTNPLDERLRGQYTGMGATRPDAVKAAVEKWRKNCQYYHPGNVVAEVPEFQIAIRRDEQPLPPRRFEFDTPGKNFWDKLADFFKAIAMVLGIIATAITFITPIPGDEVVAGLIWTSVFTSTVASGISIGRRKRNGFAGDSEDVFDVLQIVGNIFTAGRVDWGRRAVLASRSFKGQFKEFMLFGDVATDYVEGFLLATEFVRDFNDILDDPTLSPSERVDKMMGFLQDKAKKSAMYTLNVMSSKQKRREKTYIEPDMQARMRNPRERIDLDAPKVQKAETKQGEIRTKVQDEPARVRKPRGAKPRPAPRPKRNKYNFKPARPPEQRGMRADDDFDFAQQALDTGRIVLVRNSNQQMLRHVNNSTRGPKPESLKAKTLPDKPPPALKDPDHAGLASAHPDDPRLQDMLKEMKSPKTGKPPMSHEEFVEDLKKKGYDVKGPEGDYLVTGKGAPGGYYSDYDLHGVYDLKGNNGYSEAFRDQLNQRFGKELVQHGPHDLWPNRNRKEAGPNRGPQPPVTAYVPRGDRKVERFELDTVEEMRAFYEAWKIPWDKIYPPL